MKTPDLLLMTWVTPIVPDRVRRGAHKSEWLAVPVWRSTAS